MKALIKALIPLYVLCLGLSLPLLRGEGEGANFGRGSRSFLESARADDGSSGNVVADAGHDRHATPGQTLQLDASRSLSLQGQPLAYLWKVVSLPSGSQARLSNVNAVRPTFSVDVAGDYVFAVSVRAAGDGARDDSGGGGRAQVTVSTRDVAPVANAGLNRRIVLGATVALDGSRSFDADGDAITYAWSLVKVPKGSRARLSSAGALRPRLTADASGLYVARLVVTDATGKASAPAYVGLSTSAGLFGRASAGPAQFLARGATARVDADGTYLPSGAPTNASFALLAAPVGSKAALAGGLDARQTFQLDQAGDYVAQTMISSAGAAKSGEGDDASDDANWMPLLPPPTATTLLTTGNVAPRADAGDDQRVTVGQSVALDGSRSTDLNGDLLTYRWSLLSIPAGSKASLDQPASAQPKFTADVAGDYVAQLIVADAAGDATPATVVVSTQSSRPVANAGPDVFGATGAAVLLDGSASRDPSGGALAANWTILGLGDQLTGALSSPKASPTNFDIPVAGVPLTQAVLAGPAALPVVDGCDDDDRQSLRLHAVGRLTSPAGASFSIWRISNYSRASVSAMLSAANGGFSQTLSIPARDDLFVASPASAGDAAYQLVASGRVIAQAKPLGSTFADTRLVGGGPALKLSIVQLQVANDLLFDVDDVVVSTVEARPTAVPTATSPAYRGVQATLDGSRSQNPNVPTAPTSGLTYRWSLLSRPAASKATLANANAAAANFTPDVYGLYIAQLIVSDGLLDSRPRTVVVNVAPRPPVAVATATSPINVTQTETLNGAGSYDPDGNPLRG